MTQNAQEIQGIFNRIAPMYNQLNDWLSLGQHRVWKKMTVTWSNARPGDTCLDLCCGSGDIAIALSQQVGPSGYVFGVDFSPQQLAIAQHREKPFLIPSSPISWVEGDALNIPFPPNTFDAATMGYGLRNVTNIPLSLKELHRVLKKGAKAAILDFHRPDNPLMQTFQQWYLQNLVVPTAEKFNLTQEYAYINASLEKFPTGSEQIKLAYEAGFTHAVHYPIAGGMMGVLVITN
ncbi:MAG: bifunctional demethylmenaquinone methyltransferase/2-methoxy-6-polyprenyl-1,4-benzoquinol methylase UbiE [Microcoleaceae cyanobacterium]